MLPESMRCPPNHSTATLEVFITSMTIGNISAISLPTPQRNREQLVVRGVEALPLVLVADERADDADAHDLLAQHLVDLVDALLHQPERRAHLA